MTKRLSLEKRSGLALVEMALVLPVLLLLVIGVVDYGMQFYVLHLMSDAARDAAREAAIRNGTVSQAQAVAASELSGIHGRFTITVVQPAVGRPTRTSPSPSACRFPTWPWGSSPRPARRSKLGSPCVRKVVDVHLKAE